jgi:hypothetical protein
MINVSLSGGGYFNAKVLTVITIMMNLVLIGEKMHGGFIRVSHLYSINKYSLFYWTIILIQ